MKCKCGNECQRGLTICEECLDEKLDIVVANYIESVRIKNETNK